MAKKLAEITILIVDDSSETRRSLSLVLASWGFSVLEAEDGIAAEKIAREMQPDLIFMDIVMPRQDGITTIKNLKKYPETKEIPIIVLSGKVRLLDSSPELKDLVVDVLEKPFPMKTLKDTISRFFE